MANANYNDIFTTTLENRSGKIADAVSKNNALLNVCAKKATTVWFTAVPRFWKNWNTAKET